MSRFKPKSGARKVVASKNMTSPHREPVKKKPYNGYTVKEKWLVSLLLSLFAPLTLCCFGPFEIYGNNMDEFKFVLWDFWILCGLVALAGAAVLFGLLMLLRGRAFDVCFGLIFGLSFMLFIQGNYLSLGSGALAGDGVGETISMTQNVINLVIWIVVVAACIVAMLLLHKFKEILRLAATVAVVALVGMTVISFAVISLTTDVYASEKTGYQGDVSLTNEVLTVKNLDTLATDNNIVVFIVDRFDYTYMDKALEECPEVFEDLDGFTHFSDYITLYPRTYPGVPHIVTGVENDFSGTRGSYMKDAYSESPYWQALKEQDFDINVYTDDYYGYVNATHMRDFVSNTSGNVSYKIIKRAGLSVDMIRISLYRYVPFLVRHTLGNVSTPMYDKYVDYALEDPEYSTDMKGVYDVLADEEFTFRSAENGISYIHISGCHLPNRYNPDFAPAQSAEKSDSNVAMKVSFKIISSYIQEMKRMGVYESATILILGDHCNIGSDTILPNKPHVTTLLAKPAGVSEGEMKESKAQVGAQDVLATVLVAAGSDKAADFGENIFEIPENVTRSRRYQFQLVQGTLYEGNYINAEYEILGPGRD
ncbi:MAG: hypothetical protein IJA91_04345, partial [Clostridia bacterium]|nr:hypothetical protein [Clostridia bacterium]